ncbi:uncharacterized acetyltransferase At3g50280-like [Cynara cardunculus var. scolymus]|uniref:Chloramphenicol acetyltransferase-like domain-containing protein n=1 Tax=Cynara cardunculus var. scolymus TaxID=59895 RepID=A0A103XZ12_CYNCS|nr:uncharacterized acetyltransferase At3g50280-like [Cynara cardunculus var. scolymus]KVH99493.1 Chloramphenicol acetyltransferase-like domain-containing protein [Cynara cardunculus var. scolymus]
MTSSPTVTRISECFVKPPDDHLSPEEKQPIHFTPFEILSLNIKYSQKGLLFAKPPPSENQDFSIPVFLDHLRRSLSAALTHFYPFAARLATRIQENPPSYVIYLDPENSLGAKFVYATVDATVSDILTPPDVPLVVRSFFDLNNAINHDGHTLPLLSIQVTELVDGIFIGGSVNHLIADGTSFWQFMAVWSENFRSKDRASISHPPVHRRWDESDPIINLPYTHHDQFIERFEPPPFKERFYHFSSPSVSKLKSKANSECNTDKISSLQAVIALIWRCITRARRLPPEDQTSCRLMVSNRRKMNPPLSDYYLGSPVQVVRATATVEDLMAHGLGWAALRLHEVVMNHDHSKVKEMVESWIKRPVIFKMSHGIDRNAIHVGSSPRFDMYGCEFGLGKAVAARSGGANKGEGKITMYPGREGGGSMDVEVCFGSELMMDMECDEELMSALMVD